VTRLGTAWRRVAPALAAICVLAALPARAQDVPGLEARARRFYDQLEKNQKDAAAAAFPDLERDLAKAKQQIEDRLNRLRDDVVARDGDIEQLFESSEYRDSEVAGLVVGYHLAWVRYQGANLVADPKRKRALLTKSVEDFEAYTGGDVPPDIQAEATYGRGLAYLDLGDWAKARADLREAANMPRTAQKAKIALAEVDRRAAGGKEPSNEPPPPDPNDPEVLAGKLADWLPKAPNDASLQKDAFDLARGLAARGGPWPDRIGTLVAEKLGNGTPASIRSSWGLYLAAQLALDRGRCGDLAPLVAASANVQDAGRAKWRPELLFMQAGCTLNAGRAADAVQTFDVLVREFPDSPRAREAAYYRFRALDVARQGKPALDDDFRQALESYLAGKPSADGANEARWLLGDLYRAKGDCARASAEWAKVTGGVYASKAKMGGLECKVGGLSPKTTQEERAAIVAGFRELVKNTPAKGADEDMVARAALMGALVARGGTPSDDATVVELLDGYEEKYPNAKELYPRERAARLEARVATGKLDGADGDLEAWLAMDAQGDKAKTLRRLGKELSMRAQAATGPDQQKEKAQAQALAKKVYEALATTSGTPADRILVADLELRGGNPAAARKLYDEVLAADPSSSEALRGAAKAAAATGDRNGALAYWRRVLDASPVGGTGWYEARIAQVELLRDGGLLAEACQVVRTSRGRATSAGGDQLAARLQAMAPEVCK
jgi:tetratricopeptide (TPR) repeat protein